MHEDSQYDAATSGASRASCTTMGALHHDAAGDDSKSDLRLLELDLMGGIAEQHWPDTLDWPSSNMQLLFELRRTPDAAALAA